MKPAAKILGAITTAGMFVVLIMGSAVTNTGSAQGCGHSWPLCHGELIPQMAVSTAIEFSHRAVVGVETVLVLALAALSLTLYRDRKEMRVLAPLMVATLFAQALLGAWAVMYPQEAPILAIHFGVSLVSFASVLLVTAFLFEADGQELLRDRPVSPSFGRSVWLVTAYSYVVVYLGAYVRHAQADLACQGWPLCNGTVVPMLQGTILINFTHRVAAGLLVLALLWLWRRARQEEGRPDLVRGAAIALGMVALQSLSGAVVVFTRLDLFSALLHAALAGVMFGSLTYLCLHVLPRPAAPEPAAEMRPLVAQN